MQGVSLADKNQRTRPTFWPNPFDDLQGEARKYGRLDGRVSDDVWVKDILLQHKQKERCCLFFGHKTEAVCKLMRYSIP